MSNNRYSKWFVLILVALAIGFRVYWIYYPFFLSDYLVPPGDDAVSHFRYIEMILSGSWSATYPPLFHSIIALLSKVSSIDPFLVLKWLTPSLLLLPTIASFLLLKRLFDRQTALLGLFVGLWASAYGLLAFGDGNYPNILAAGFFMPLALGFYASAFIKRPRANLFWAAIFVLLTVLTHHLSFVLFIAIALFYLVVVGIWNKFEIIAPHFKKVGLSLIVLIAISLLVSFLLPVRINFISALTNFWQTGYFFNQTTFTKLLDFSEYPLVAGTLNWYAGGLATLYLIAYLFSSEESRKKSAVLLVVCWVAVTFILSRLTVFGLPGRFAREIGFPLGLALAVATGLEFIRLKNVLSRFVVGSALAFFVILNMVQINSMPYGPPGFFERMVWFTSEDKLKSDTISRIMAENDSMISNPVTPYLPIMAKRTIVFPSLAWDLSGDSLREHILSDGFGYVYAGKITKQNPPGDTYPFFEKFDEITVGLKEAADGHFKEYYKFPDGSVIYRVR